MCVINMTYGFVFVHVPKSAGTAVSHALTHLCTPFDFEIGGTEYGEAFQKVFMKRWAIRKHSSASEIRGFLGHDRWQRMTSFAFVRNPYERAFSTYTYLRQHVKERPVMANFDTFTSFVESDWWDGLGPDRMLQPQTTWTNTRGGAVVDFVGQVETIENDLDEALRLSGVGIAKREMLRIGRENASKAPSSEPPVITAAALTKLTKRYASDFDQFGYDQGAVPFTIADA